MFCCNKLNNTNIKQLNKTNWIGKVKVKGFHLLLNKQTVCSYPCCFVIVLWFAMPRYQSMYCSDNMHNLELNGPFKVWCFIFQGSTLQYPAGDLAFSVVLYLSTAVATLILLLCRRKIRSLFGGAELGGKVKGKWVSAVILILFWCFYVVMSSLQSKGIISVNI